MTISMLEQADQSTINGTSRPSQYCSGWTDVLPAGGLDAADNAGNDITNPESQIAAEVVYLHGRGTTLLLRAAYSAANSMTTDPQIQVFGRRDEDDPWMRLKNKESTPAYNVTISDAASDLTDGTFKYTDPSYTVHAFDLCGCDQLKFGVKVAAVGTAIDAAKLQAKVI